jgi:hypothetical protein
MNMHTKALEALHTAATAIKALSGITDVSVDNDGRSGEILFNVGDQRYALRLVEENTEGLRSHERLCPHRVAGECLCGASEHNAKIYGEEEE